MGTKIKIIANIGLFCILCNCCTNFTKNENFSSAEPIIKQTDLVNTMWVFNVETDYQSYYLFKEDNRCTYYCCEMGYEYSGIYFLIDNFIVISISDTDLREDQKRDVSFEIWKIENDTIYHKAIYDLSTGGVWEKTTGVSIDYKFHKLK